MIIENAYKLDIDYSQIAIWRFFLVLSVVLLFSFTIFSQTQILQPDENTLVVEDAPEQEIFAFGKTVIVRQKAKGVLSFGGNVIIEGEVSGEVAAIGGSIIQKEKALIGGDVFVFGGKYDHELKVPLRNKGKETIIYAGYEEEIRSLAQNPTQIFSPTLSWGFVAQRMFSLLFWFGISFLLTLITPGGISRAITRFQLTTLKVFGIGSIAFIAITLGVMIGFGVLPSYASGILSLVSFILLMLSYVFGRVTMQASFGKWLLKKFSPTKKPSETIALFAGAFFWTIMLSIPYVWTVALFILFTTSLGLVLTARSAKETWVKA